MRRRVLTTSCNTTPEVPRLVLLIDSHFMQMHPLKYNGKDLIKSKHAIVSDFSMEGHACCRQLWRRYPRQSYLGWETDRHRPLRHAPIQRSSDDDAR
ncbi:unnamed protein product [Prunus armeniaca]|uniref:Uncharacterized protein n=1 Tax=Prunus armeniaca TaxID=36596 RepID=A0A6J5U2Q3_PRUAR|nr:unnamed protein product [Prunus armeniaca]